MKMTLTISDSDDGLTTIKTDLDPPITEDMPSTGASVLAASVLDWIDGEVKRRHRVVRDSDEAQS